MQNSEIVRFAMYEMEYRGGPVASDMRMVPFEARYYAAYKTLIDECFCPMRKALNIRPYEAYCDELDALMREKENIFLLPDGGRILCAVTCLENEIEGVAVNVRCQRQGYGRKVIAFALHHMQQRGDDPIRLTVTKWNQGAIALYQAMGFVIVKETMVEGVNTRDAQGNWSFVFTQAGGLNIQ